MTSLQREYWQCSLFFLLGDMFLHYNGHGHCSLFWVNPTDTNSSFIKICRQYENYPQPYSLKKKNQPIQASFWLSHFKHGWKHSLTLLFFFSFILSQHNQSNFSISLFPSIYGSSLTIWAIYSTALYIWFYHYTPGRFRLSSDVYHCRQIEE